MHGQCMIPFCTLKIQAGGINRDYRHNIDLMHQTKVEMNQKKLEADGVVYRTIDDQGQIHAVTHTNDLGMGKPTHFFDLDDKGNIYYDELIPFTPWYPTYGDRAVGPVEIARMRAKVGCNWSALPGIEYCPEMVLNLFCHGPIERGVDCCDGGVDIYNFTQDAVAMPSVADSFAAIEQRVVKEKRLTWRELKHVLDTNCEGAEDIRLMLKNIERYGSG